MKLVLALLLTLSSVVQVQAAPGAKPAVKMIEIWAKKGYKEVAEILAPYISRQGDDFQAVMRTIRATMEDIRESGDQTSEKILARVLGTLGEDHPHYKDAKRLLQMTDKQLAKMSDADRVAMMNVFNTLSAYGGKYKLRPLCDVGCSGPVDVSFALEGFEGKILKSLQAKFLREGEEVNLKAYLRDELQDLQRTLQVKLMIKEKTLSKGAFKKLMRDVQTLSEKEQTEMLFVLHAMTRSFSSLSKEDESSREIFVTLLKFNSDDLLANRLWRMAINKEKENLSGFHQKLKDVVKQYPSERAEKKFDIFIGRMDEEIAERGKIAATMGETAQRQWAEDKKLWEEVKASNFCGMRKGQAAI